MQLLEVSAAVRRIYMSLGSKRLMRSAVCVPSEDVPVLKDRAAYHYDETRLFWKLVERGVCRPALLCAVPLALRSSDSLCP